jgi:hypothetical protein
MTTLKTQTEMRILSVSNARNANPALNPRFAGIVGVQRARKIAWRADISTVVKIVNFVLNVDFAENARNAANAETAFAVHAVSGVPNVLIANFA